VLGELKEGALIKDIFTGTLEKIRTERPDLESHFVKNMGFAVSAGLARLSPTIDV
jgi:nucleosome binding factor SPN SPT16 subunit